MRRVAFAAAALGLVLPGVATADGFRIVQGGPSIGNAGAGSAAAAEDPATAFFNPAGMSLVKDGAAFHANAIRVGVKFEDEGSATGGRPLTGDDHESIHGTGYVPAAFAVHRLNDAVTIGLAVTSPFGLESDYPDEWVGRYQATHSSLETIDVAPCVAIRLSPALSIGVGVDLQYLRADLRNAVDFGTIAVREDPAIADSLGLEPQRDDGSARLHGESFAAGGNLGVLWQAADATRLGLSIRSAVRHSIDGEATFDVPKSARRLLLSGDFHDTDASTVVTLPEVVSLGVAHSPSRDWTLLAGVDYTRWSRFEELDVHLDDTRDQPPVEDESWHDTWRPAVGAVYRPDDRWTLRAGVAWDPSTVDAEHRRPRDPDLSRTSVACGVGCRLSESASVEFAYLYAWSPSGGIDAHSPNAGRIRGEYRTTLHYLSLAVTIGF